MSNCPVCDEAMTVYSDDERIDPTEYHCDACGFQWIESSIISMAEAADSFIEWLVVQVPWVQARMPVWERVLKEASDEATT